MALQEEHQEAFQKVRRGVREEAERRRRVSRSEGERTLGWGGGGLVGVDGGSQSRKGANGMGREGRKGTYLRGVDAVFGARGGRGSEGAGVGGGEEV